MDASFEEQEWGEPPHAERLRRARRGHGRGQRHGFIPPGFPFGPGRGFGPPGAPPFPLFGGQHWPGWESRGPRARRGDVRVAALALLAEQPMNGYQIIQEIKQRSGGLWTPSSGSVYPALQQLEDEGLIRAGEYDGRRAFALTDEGRRYVDEHVDELQAPWESAAEGVAEDAIGLRETFGRTFGALMQVWQVGTDEQREQAAQVLKETRKALYRILAEDENE
jgi:DNA-binding PadR family transcriptional regulator